MREYAPGDDIRRIVWRAYARTGQLLVREAEQGITDKITSSSTRTGATTAAVSSESFEAGVARRGLAGVRHLEEGYSVTLEGNEKREIGPVRGRTLRWTCSTRWPGSSARRRRVTERSPGWSRPRS